MSKNLVAVDRYVKTPAGQATVREKLPSIQAGAKMHLPSVMTIVASDAPTNLFRNNGAKYRFQLNRGVFTSAHNLVLRFGITINTAACVIVPTPFWFDRIDVRLNSDNTTLATSYSDTLMFNILSRASYAQATSLFRNLNIGDGANGPRLGLTNSLAVGTYYFELPLTSSFFSNADFLFSRSEQDLILELTPSSGIISSGAGSVDLSSLSLIVETAIRPQQELVALEKSFAQSIHSTRYLDIVPVSSYSRALAGGTTTKIDLQNLSGHCAFMVMCVRNTSASNTSNGQFKLLDLGAGTVDLVNESSQSVLGMGSALPLQYVRNMLPVYHMNSDVLANKAYYLIPFCENIRAAFDGVIDGCQRFTGSNMQLAVTPATAVQEVQTLTLSAAAASGSYRLAFNGEMTGNLLYNATPATIQSALAALPYFARYNITCVVSAALSAGTTVTFTFTCPERGLEGNTIGVVPNALQSSAPAIITFATARTTPGVQGIDAGNYDVTILAYLYKHLSMFKGRFQAALL